ncbi:hypothetical protein PAT3040_03135 [Paenibacillus agaridevorans]|uniref:Uncharacterized protein n=1 Tax=Paenibacillus agaridevorans TaxID=171404 RepID=A0A2R5EU19_9BACL|nr:hypothetical protein [Paenibacillus agaridevorans]GBG08548.1 hypothetical protein PAT3040_03135 [Paenibacillus agaridevorans]
MNWKLIHQSGETYQADFSLLSKSDLVQLKKSDGWSRGLNWSTYLASNHECTAYKLHITGNPIIQGLIAIAIKDGFVEVDLIEKAPFNRKPRNEFINVGEVLFCLACQTSFDNNGEGYVLLQAKTGLLEHYIDHYGMEVVNSKKRLLAIPTVEANRLIELYLI